MNWKLPLATLFAGLGLGLLLPWLFEEAPQSSVIAQPAKEVEKVVWVTKPCPGIKAAPEATRKELGIPEAVQGDVVAAVRIPGDDHPHTLTGIYSPETMTVTLLDRRDPLPWLAYTGRWRAGMYYGASDDRIGAYRLTAGYELYKVKLINLGAVGSLESGGRWFAGVGGEIKF